MVAVAASLELHADSAWEAPSGVVPALAPVDEIQLCVDIRVAEPERGHLAESVWQCVEQELQSQGAPPPSVPATCTFAEHLADQLYRGRLLGYRSLRLRWLDLSAIAPDGVLSPEDSAVLRGWSAAADGDALCVEWADEVLQLQAYAAPVSLSQLLAKTSPLLASASRLPATTSPPAAAPSEPAATELRPADARAAGAATAHTELKLVTATLSGQPLSSEARETDTVSATGEAPAAEETRAVIEFADPEPEQDACYVDSDPAEDTAPDFSDVCCEAAPEPSHVSAWRTALQDASGTQTWDNLERLFLTSYLPLAHWAADHPDQPAVEHALQAWALNFQHCYQAAFARLRSGAPRPAMVLDVPQLAFGAAREADAAQVKLVLVDGMRFDLGQRVHDKLRLQLTGIAQCVERRVLWSALPAMTATQLELLARGAYALGRTAGTLDERARLAKGNDTRKLRALRVGPHTVRKLDILEAEFARARWTPEELDRAAAEVAVSVGRFIKQQADNTLVVVFGDHGMSAAPTPRAAAPEEVLVPYHAWFVHGMSGFSHNQD